MQLQDTDWMRVSDAPNQERGVLIGRWQDKSVTEELYQLNGVEIWRRRFWPASRVGGAKGEVWLMFDHKEA